MKREIARYVSEYDTYRKVNTDYMKPRGLLQPEHSRMEVGQYKHELHSGLTNDCLQV
jgi:hypothetical protein